MKDLIYNIISIQCLQLEFQVHCVHPHSSDLRNSSTVEIEYLIVYSYFELFSDWSSHFNLIFCNFQFNNKLLCWSVYCILHLSICAVICLHLTTKMKFSLNSQFATKSFGHTQTRHRSRIVYLDDRERGRVDIGEEAVWWQGLAMIYDSREPSLLIILVTISGEKIYCQRTSILSLQQMKLADFVLSGIQ